MRYRIVPPVVRGGRAVDINTEILNDYEIQALPPRKFRQLLLAAVHGEVNTFSRFMRPAQFRPCARVWAALRTHVFRRDDYTCRYCGKRGGRLECDHAQPVSRGGSHDQDNLVTACFKCNREKLTKTVAEFLEWRRVNA